MLQVTVEMVMKTLRENGKHAVQLILAAVPLIAQLDWTDTIKDHQVVLMVLTRLGFGIIIVSTLPRWGA
jgi:hypothetical protein